MPQILPCLHFPDKFLFYNVVDRKHFLAFFYVLIHFPVSLIKEIFSVVLRRLDGREKFDYVFMDPPYNHMLEKEVLTYLAKSDLLEKDALIIVEASLATDFSYLEELGFLMIKQKKYKTNMHVFISVEE